MGDVTRHRTADGEWHEPKGGAEVQLRSFGSPLTTGPMLVPFLGWSEETEDGRTLEFGTPLFGVTMIVIESETMRVPRASAVEMP